MVCSLDTNPQRVGVDPFLTTFWKRQVFQLLANAVMFSLSCITSLSYFTSTRDEIGQKRQKWQVSSWNLITWNSLIFLIRCIQVMYRYIARYVLQIPKKSKNNSNQKNNSKVNTTFHTCLLRYPHCARFRVISARTWARAKRKRFPSN